MKDALAPLSRQAEPAADALSASCIEAAPILTPGLSDVTILTIDDDPLMTDVIQIYLEEAGYTRCVAINDPRQAVEQASSLRPGLVLLDLMMPGVSGFEVLAQMRQVEALRYTPVIVLTAANNAAAKLQALSLGATEFLAKPVDSSELVLRVRNSLVFKVYQDRLARLDPLTGLPNRGAFVDQLRDRLQSHGAGPQPLALLHIGLDRFRQINDSLGHSAGDELLVDVANRFQDTLRRSAGSREDGFESPLVMSRLAGDEFAVLVPKIGSADAAARMAGRLLAALAQSFSRAGQELFVTASIGIAIYPSDGIDDQALMRGAEAALAHAKSGGRNTYRFYSPELDGASLARLLLESQLRRAIERDELVLHYQPKVQIGSGRVVGAEALLRWHHPTEGMIPPDRFIPLAEETGLIVDIGHWVVRKACQQLAHWRAAGLGELKLAVNISRQEVKTGELLGRVLDAMRAHAIEPGQLVIELTESMLMEPDATTRAQLDGLRAQGIALSIDDFGTGYSSMNYLKRFPLDELKIDKSFVDGTPADATNSAIVQALIVLGHSLGMRVVAEGVEEARQLSMLHGLGCDEFQGYLCSRPLPAAEFIELIRRLQPATE